MGRSPMGICKSALGCPARQIDHWLNWHVQSRHAQQPFLPSPASRADALIVLACPCSRWAIHSSVTVVSARPALALELGDDHLLSALVCAFVQFDTFSAGDRNDVLGGTRPGCGRRPAIRNQEPRKEVMKNTEIPALGRAAGYRVDELARLAGISVRSLQRRFASQFRSAPHQWLNALRLHDAKQLLKSGCSVKETAGTLGYSDASHFSRDFASLHGLCPIDFARKHPADRRNDANGHDFGAFGHGEGLYNDAQVVQ
jgi:AraC-like DNA-binding protein